MKNRAIADIFHNMADLMEILGEQTFRVNSYRRCARALEELTEPIEDRIAQDTLTELPGVGSSMAAKIREFCQTGRIEQYQKLLDQVPPGLPELLRISGLGPKMASHLWHEAGIESLEQLRKALAGDAARLTQVHGMGEKKIQALRESLKFIESTGQRVPLGQADIIADQLAAAIRAESAAQQVVVAGSVRRGRETIGDVDLLCQASPQDAAAIISAFTSAPQVARVLAKGSTKASVVLAQQVQADLRVVAPESFGAAWAYFTGSKAHNVRLRSIALAAKMKLNEYGLFRGETPVAGPDEQGLYEALGLQYVPPELREDTGEVEAAQAGKLPRLVTQEDIRGDLHMHTRASDGRNTIDEMIQACQARGYQYLAITEHSKAQVQAHGLTDQRVREHAAEIRRAAGRHDKMMVLAGLEVDIFKDGSLDCAAEVLGELDFVIASPHSALSMGRQEATERLVSAIASGLIHCVGHPSGRIINQRPGMDLDMDRIAAAAAEHDVALELNSHYMRLDVRDSHVRAAVKAGAKIMINTDAHEPAELDMIRYGLVTARRGWAAPTDVVNTWTPQRLRQWLKRKR